MWQRAPVAGRGFGALATVPIPAGTLVLRTTATASLPLDLSATCAHCFAPAALRCARCKLLKYCSRGCQRADWPSHGGECKYLTPYMASASGPPPTPTVLLAARLHSLGATIDPSDFATNLDAHTPDAIQRYRDMSALVLQILGAANNNDVADTLPSMHCLLLTFALLNCNAFTVCSPEQVPIGIGFFPVAAAWNHACVPNCVATFRGRELHLRALRPISPGDELTIAYTEMVAPTRARRLELATSYFFHCDCLRCMGSGSCWAKKEPLLEGLGCSQSGCAGRLEPAIDGAVNTCPTCLTVTECDDVTPRLVQRAIQAADDAERRKDVPKAIASRQRAYALTQASYHKYHADNIAGAETLANLIMSAENARFRDAAQNSLALALYASALEGLRWLYGPELAPLRGLTTLKYAQALHLANPRAKDEALRLVQEACPLLATTHGDDSSVVATAITLLHELQRTE